MRDADGTAIGTWGPYVLKSAFQPIFSFEGGTLRQTAVEGLIRPFRGSEPVAPEHFFQNLPVAERFDVETLSRTLHLLNAGAVLTDKALLFVNFDPSLFTDRSVAATALRDMRLALTETSLAPARIVCELTEQKSASEAALKAFVEALKAEGYFVAVDDYGADDSDLKRIESLHPDIVKFDARWVGRLMQTSSGFAALAEMVAKFAERGIRSVFEGIEESWQLMLAEKSGAAMVQGYVLARPEIGRPAGDSTRAKKR